HVQRCPVRLRSCVFESKSFSVFHAGVRVKTCADNVTFRGHHNRSDVRVRRSQGGSLARQLQRLAHIAFVLQARNHSRNKDFTKLSGLKGSKSPAFSPTPT